jgi:hypothetical protein
MRPPSSNIRNDGGSVAWETAVLAVLAVIVILARSSQCGSAHHGLTARYHRIAAPELR